MNNYPEKCPKCGEYLIYTNGQGFYRTLNMFTVKEQGRVRLTSHECSKSEAAAGSKVFSREDEQKNQGR